MVASFNQSRPTDIICNICQYEDGRFWNLLDYKGREPGMNMIVIDCRMRYEVQDVRAWCEAECIFQEAGKFFIDQSQNNEANR